MVNCTWTVDAPSACPIAGSDGRYMSMVNGPSAVRNDSSNVRPNVPGRSIAFISSPVSPSLRAKRSNPVLRRRLDCFVASLLAMTNALSLPQRLDLQLRREPVELRQQRRRDRHAVAQPLGAALRAAVAGQPDFIDAGEPLRLAEVIRVAIDFGGECRQLHEARDVDRDHEMPGIGLARIVGVE